MVLDFLAKRLNQCDEQRAIALPNGAWWSCGASGHQLVTTNDQADPGLFINQEFGNAAAG